MFNLQDHVGENSIVNHCAFPDGYPLYYLTADSGVLCPSCVEKEHRADPTLLTDPNDPQWYVVKVEVNWEDETLYCDHCGTLIDSAYGDE